MNKISLLILTAVLLLSKAAFSQTNFYDLNTIQTVEVYFSDPNWDYNLDTAKAGLDSFIVANYALINGVRYDSVGVKYKGNSSYNSTYTKNPMHIALDEFRNQSYNGVTNIKLGNGYADPSMIREVMAYELLGNYMHCPKSNFAKLYINGNYIGLYSNDETINKDFCSTHFYSSSNAMFKCNPIITPGPATKSNLKFIPGSDSSGYFNFYELKSDYGWNELVALCDSLSNNNQSLENVMDVDKMLWMLAFNNAIINLDSYSGVFAQNYYLYKDNTNRFVPIVWDLNMAFGGFPFLGSAGSSMAGLTITNMQQLPLNIHATDSYWPLIVAVMSNPLYKKMYEAHVKTIMTENFTNGRYQTIASQLQTLIANDVAADTNKFFSDSDFQGSMFTNVQNGSYQIPGIENLMSGRSTYLMSTPELTNAQPVITNVTVSDTFPSINASVTFSANVSNATIVNLMYRANHTDRFTKMVMYDDGLHNDGSAADGIYGTVLAIQTWQIEYYIYAENALTVKFSPERAEYVFYTLTANVPTAALGEVVINEFMPVNQTGATDETGQTADWIELKNVSGNTVSLYSLHLTDDYTNPTKFTFPVNAVIPPNGYLIVWADEDPTTGNNIHCNFKLSGNGEQLMLSGMNNAIYDSITYGVPLAHVSIARCPDGTGAFSTQTTPTFNSLNCSPTILNGTYGIEAYLFPNPAQSHFYLKNIKQGSVKIVNMLGEVVRNFQINENESIFIGDLPSGSYTVVSPNKSFRLSIIW